MTPTEALTQQADPAAARLDFDVYAAAFAKALAHLDHAAVKQLDRVNFDPRLRELVRLRASQLNGCAYCVDMHSTDARAIDETEQRLAALTVWRDTPFFDERERAALAFTEAVTLMASARHVPDDLRVVHPRRGSCVADASGQPLLVRDRARGEGEEALFPEDLAPQDDVPGPGVRLLRRGLRGTPSGDRGILPGRRAVAPVVSLVPAVGAPLSRDRTARRPAGREGRRHRRGRGPRRTAAALAPGARPLRDAGR